MSTSTHALPSLRSSRGFWGLTQRPDQQRWSSNYRLAQPLGDAPNGDDDWRRCICTCICTLLGFDEGNDPADSYELGR
jgi:hypothetical protein